MKAKIKFEFPKELREDGKLFKPFEGIYNKYKTNDDPPYKIVFDKFRLQNANRQKKDRTQIHETNLYPIITSFGPKAKIYQFQLRLRNSKTGSAEQFYDSDDNPLTKQDYNWFEEFELLYDILNPKVVMDYGLKMYVEYDDKVFRGVWLDFNSRENAQNDNVVNCNFQFVVSADYYSPVIEGGGM